MKASAARQAFFRTPSILSLILLLVLPVAAQDSLISDGSFEQWEDGVPTGWKIGVGAQTGGDEPKSVVRKIKGPALMLRGDRSTRLWHSVSQRFSARPQAYYRVVFEARTKDLKRESNQYDNCYVGFVMWDADGQRLSLEVRNVFETQWAKGQLVIRAPNTTAAGEVMIFLSKTGILGVKNVHVEELRPEDSFGVLVDELDRYYSFFDHKGIDWKKLTSRYRARAEAANNPAEFVTVAKEMLAELKDIHVGIQMPDGRKVPAFSSSFKPNFDFNAVAKKLQSHEQIGRLGFVGRTAEGYGVVAVGTMLADDATVQQLETAVEGLLGAPGIIVDLRANSGGDERMAGRLSATFADKRRVYATSKIRSGPGHNDFHQQPGRIIEPRRGKTFTRPLVCLIGPGCASSGEAFAMMMKALPHATLVGQPTRGASGNPGTVILPNGVTVGYSRWVSLLPDGTVLEDKGVPPDVTVRHQGPGDPTFDAAVKILSERVKPSGIQK